MKSGCVNKIHKEFLDPLELQKTPFTLWFTQSRIKNKFYRVNQKPRKVTSIILLRKLVWIFCFWIILSFSLFKLLEDSLKRTKIVFLLRIFLILKTKIYSGLKLSFVLFQLQEGLPLRLSHLLGHTVTFSQNGERVSSWSLHLYWIHVKMDFYRRCWSCHEQCRTTNV